MNALRFAACTLAATCFAILGLAQTNNDLPSNKPPITIVTDPSWDVSQRPSKFDEFPLPAEQIASATSPLWGGTNKAVVADHNGRGKIIPGTVPIWRKRKASGEQEAYQFRKTVQLEADPIHKITLQVNCDDVARVYINKRLASAPMRDGKMKDGYDDWYFFRSVSGFMYDRVYTYDVTDYFFANYNNTIFIEAVSLAFDGSHAYFSAKIVIEFAPIPAPAKPTAVTLVEPKPVVERKKEALPPPPIKAAVAQTAAPKKTLFEAGREPEIENLHVGSILELGQVFFEANEYQLNSRAYYTLAALAKFLRQHPGLKIEVGGHTNLRPSLNWAAELSTKRAQTVMRYLTDNGVAVDRVSHKGYGKSQPRNRAISEEADDANQRVEVKILEK